jgi:ubiquinone/menaquinone biosynthesis C-methylase UbiE
MEQAQRTFVPAAGKNWRLPFYDLMAWALGANGARAVLVEHIAARPGERLLEIGCGTGSLVIALKRAQPGAEVVGLDPDPGALTIARRKAARARTEIAFDQGFADALPYPDASFDVVASSFMYHHLPPAVKVATVREVRRVLKPGGRLHLLDFDGPGGLRPGFIGRHLHFHGMMRENAEERVLAVLREGGFHDARLVSRRATTIPSAYYLATAS